MLPTLTRTAATLQSALMTALPHGGQGTARRNAWASMAADATRARHRREAAAATAAAMDAAVARAAAMAQHPATGGR